MFNVKYVYSNYRKRNHNENCFAKFSKAKQKLLKNEQKQKFSLSLSLWFEFIHFQLKTHLSFPEEPAAVEANKDAVHEPGKPFEEAKGEQAEMALD